MKVRGLYFDYHELLSLLKKEIQGKQNPQKKISKIDEESTTYRIFDTDDSGKVLKVTATMKAIEVYNIDLSKPSGERLIENIKDNVSGKRLEDAKNYIINLPEVAGVEIQSWPAWAPTIPTIPDNIDVVIRD
jgi:ATP-dependent RNA circularization protein (DNA/RNA ligase family)